MATYRYIIRETTMFIRPVMENHKLKSEVKEMGKPPFIIEQKPLTIIEQSCHFYNTTYTARKETTRIIADICHKPPIIIKPETSTYFFPSHSDRVAECYWFNLGLIKSYCKGKFNDSRIEFDDDTIEIFPISHHIINTQYLHSIKLEYCLRTKSIKNNHIDKEVDYKRSSLSIYEVLAMYAMIEKRV
ncbi:hypothetical protein ERX37_00400 [Macrococcus hajekii]|uniref:Competence protein ComK n=1 Tax=Macrococcus hajekii TaxID=198482 RepID=A0A4R6BLK6_9STAP|nr:competence protein ComK [Macrococcus hajekii]TDM02591.1 hypothetical protein ERX37_00400 [Macrococcus hajekii]GGB02216.1 competence protein ComK [Macrococcus hajekii]